MAGREAALDEGLKAPVPGFGPPLAGALAVVGRFVASRHPQAEAALLAGSQVRGEATEVSDYDVILLFGHLPDGAWRETARFEGRDIEVFAHDLGSLAYFCREVDRPSGIAALPAMVAEGADVFSRPCRLLDEAREIARATLELGPPPLDAEAIRIQRYAITDLATALENGRSAAVLIAAAARLHGALSDFALRAAGCWSAKGKAIPGALRAMDADFANRFDAAFAKLFAEGETAPVQALVDGVLAPHGGRLREGFRRNAPAASSALDGDR